MKWVYLLAYLFITIVSLYGQSSSNYIAQNTLFVELGGNGVLYSVNYDRIFYNPNSIIKGSIRTGLTFIPGRIYAPANFFISFPLELNVMFGRKHHIEYGMGYTPFFHDKYNEKNKVTTSGIDHAILLRLGYRYQKSQGGLFMRAAFTPIIYNSSNAEYGFFPWVGLGMGVSF